jgi:hypothetical protein
MPVMARLRVLRSLAVVATVMALAAGAHVAGGGPLPAPVIMLGLGVLCLVPVTMLSSRRFSLPALSGVVGGGQFLLHQAFTVLSLSASCLPPAAETRGHHTHVTSLACRLPGAPAAGHAISDAAGVLMFAAHALATAAIVLMLARSEEALWLLTAWLRPLVLLLRPAAVPAIRLRRGIDGPVFRPAAAVCPHVHGLRGPPSRRAPVLKPL